MFIGINLSVYTVQCSQPFKYIEQLKVVNFWKETFFWNICYLHCTVEENLFALILQLLLVILDLEGPLRLVASGSRLVEAATQILEEAATKRLARVLVAPLVKEVLRAPAQGLGEKGGGCVGKRGRPLGRLPAGHHVLVSHAGSSPASGEGLVPAGAEIVSRGLQQGERARGAGERAGGLQGLLAQHRVESYSIHNSCIFFTAQICCYMANQISLLQRSWFSLYC